ncbi:hypothetical protein M9H77_21836 [Catharanthus roseus]|uniref:Uncharacterized protein n=1 Tax=Catharanthus roseus TaxID=4058 RepID=A0ACC0ASV4_CATRO|nr:hypothetical protein M9H77_21836 [Catharanthus roseus]
MTLSPLTNSLRSHFFKHLLCSTTATHFSAHRLRRLFPIGHRSSSYFSSERRQSFWLAPKLATFSTSPSSSSTASLEAQTGDSFTAPYLSVNIRCQRNVADMLSEALLCFGASSTSMDEVKNSQADDEICVNSIFPIGENVKECISHAVDSIGLKEIPSYDVAVQDHIDWIKESQESFHPTEVMEGLWIVPEWRKPPDHQATNIILNPGLAFGTGEHPTTKLCLMLLRDSIKGGEILLDYGTGSGILAIAALKFGAAFSVGLDIDPQAITSARHNATLNNIQPEKLFLNLVSSQGTSSIIDGTSVEEINRHQLYDTRFLTETEKFDVVIANILLNPLLDLSDIIVSHAKPGAIVGLSGIISEQIPRVIERYSEFLDGITVSKMDDWACISGSKKRNPRSI